MWFCADAVFRKIGNRSARSREIHYRAKVIGPHSIHAVQFFVAVENALEEEEGQKCAWTSQDQNLPQKSQSSAPVLKAEYARHNESRSDFLCGGHRCAGSTKLLIRSSFHTYLLRSCSCVAVVQVLTLLYLCDSANYENHLYHTGPRRGCHLYVWTARFPFSAFEISACKQYTVYVDEKNIFGILSRYSKSQLCPGLIWGQNFTISTILT